MCVVPSTIGSKSAVTASRFAGFCRVLGIIFTLWILFFNAKWNNTITVEIKLGFAHPLLTFRWNFSFPQVPPGWGKKKNSLEQQLSKELCLRIKIYSKTFINNPHPFSYTSLCILITFLRKARTNLIATILMRWSWFNLSWGKLPLPFSILFPKNLYQCVKLNLCGLIWLDFWKEEELAVLNYSFMTQCGVILKHAEVQADPGMWAEHQIQLGCLNLAPGHQS